MKLFYFALSIFTFLSFSTYANAQSFNISYTNNTKQTLTTSVCVAHDSGFKIFRPNKKSSEGIKLLAEDGDESTLIKELRANNKVKALIAGDFVSAGNSASLTINSKGAKHISCIFGMLTATNDAFVAVRSIKLPTKKSSSAFNAIAYDAGTEQNTESCEHVPGGPCNAHFIGISENGVILAHPGIQGIADLSIAQHGWSEPSVTGTITKK